MNTPPCDNFIQTAPPQPKPVEGDPVLLDGIKVGHVSAVCMDEVILAIYPEHAAAVKERFNETSIGRSAVTT